MVENVSKSLSSAVGSYVLLRFRLSQLGLKFVFKPVSHQILGNPNYHLDIRNDDVQYMRQNPQRLIESNTESSWNDMV